MKNFILLTFIGILFTSCDSNESIEPELSIYQVVNRNGNTVPVTVRDYLDGTGEITGNILYSEATIFEATFDYVNDDKTNFSLQIAESQPSITFVSGTGNYTQDSIFISLNLIAAGMDVEEVYIGAR